MFLILSGRPNRGEIASTVAKPHPLAFSAAESVRLSFALWLIVGSASLSMCRLTREYVLNTFASAWTLAGLGDGVRSRSIT
jgi:hypothetical protein